MINTHVHTRTIKLLDCLETNRPMAQGSTTLCCDFTSTHGSCQFPNSPGSPLQPPLRYASLPGRKTPLSPAALPGYKVSPLLHPSVSFSKPRRCPSPLALGARTPDRSLNFPI